MVYVNFFLLDGSVVMKLRVEVVVVVVAILSACIRISGLTKRVRRPHWSLSQLKEDGDSTPSSSCIQNIQNTHNLHNLHLPNLRNVVEGFDIFLPFVFIRLLRFLQPQRLPTQRCQDRIYRDHHRLQTWMLKIHQPQKLLQAQVDRDSSRSFLAHSADIESMCLSF